MEITPNLLNKIDEIVTSFMNELLQIDRAIDSDERISPEDQLKIPIYKLISAASSVIGGKIRIITEHRQTKNDDVSGVRLDIAVKHEAGPLIGHIELKSSRKGANPYKPKSWSSHDKRQWKKLQNHSNLIYTNGREWSLVRQGLKAPMVHVRLEPNAHGEIPNSQLMLFAEMLNYFLRWKPSTPSSPKALAQTLAPLTAFLRDSVKDTISDNEVGALDGLYSRWKNDLMPGATKSQFADSFAQTFTYSLLLARVESTLPSESFSIKMLPASLRKNGHKLLGSVLELMAQDHFRKLVEDPITLLEATIGAIDTNKFITESDPWLYFYEDFLAAYDPKMRKESGVYYTPIDIVQAQVRLVDHAVKTRLGRARGLGDDDVIILDPAAGTATYPLAIINHVLEYSKTKEESARSLARRLNAFELLVGPYAVAHLRMTQLLESTGIEIDGDSVNVFFTNTLLAAGDLDQDTRQYALWKVEADLTEEARKAGIVKDKQTAVRVIIGNPPYKRGRREDSLGTHAIPNIVLEEHSEQNPLIDDFIFPLKKVGAGGQAKNLYNLYIYFIRWALWKACQQNPTEPGIVSFITASSYLRGPGFAGVREYMRRIFDEIWIIDLGGDNRGARKEENVFSIETPVAIFVGIQHEMTVNKDGVVVAKLQQNRMRSKAEVYYRRIFGNRDEKLKAVRQIESPDESCPQVWAKLPKGRWSDKFVPSSAAALADGIPLTSIFPLCFSGSKAGRTWVIGAGKEVLRKRLLTLSNADKELGSHLFSDSPTGRKYDVASTSSMIPDSKVSTAISDEKDLANLRIARYGFRSFDRGYCIADHRVIDRPGLSWMLSQNSRQIFITSVSATPLGVGPALTVSPYPTDLHFFKGSYGGRDVMPLYKDIDLMKPNVSRSLISVLASTYGTNVSPEDIVGYVVGQLGTGAYTRRFLEELSESVACVIFTKNYSLFEQVSFLGKKLIFEATWGERGGEINRFGQVVTQRFEGAARIQKSVANGAYPESRKYDRENSILYVGEGIFTHVAPEVMDYSVSGMGVVDSWLGYRLKDPAGKASSPLDRIQSDSWIYDLELLELLWQVEFFVRSEEEATALLDKVISGDIIDPSDIGTPEADELRAPKLIGDGMSKLDFGAS